MRLRTTAPTPDGAFALLARVRAVRRCCYARGEILVNIIC